MSGFTMHRKWSSESQGHPHRLEQVWAGGPFGVVEDAAAILVVDAVARHAIEHGAERRELRGERA